MNEEFDKFMKTTFEPEHQFSECDLTTAYLAGATAMREKCAEMTDNFTLGRYRENEYEFDLMTERIAAAIRKIGVE